MIPSFTRRSFTIRQILPSQHPLFIYTLPYCKNEKAESLDYFGNPAVSWKLMDFLPLDPSFPPHPHGWFGFVEYFI
jgi:hypothetical protein